MHTRKPVFKLNECYTFPQLTLVEGPKAMAWFRNNIHLITADQMLGALTNTGVTSIK